MHIKEEEEEEEEEEEKEKKEKKRKKKIKHIYFIMLEHFLYSPAYRSPASSNVEKVLALTQIVSQQNLFPSVTSVHCYICDSINRVQSLGEQHPLPR
jgi:hypothetical protein